MGKDELDLYGREVRRRSLIRFWLVVATVGFAALRVLTPAASVEAEPDPEPAPTETGGSFFIYTGEPPEGYMEGPTRADGSFLLIPTHPPFVLPDIEPVEAPDPCDSQVRAYPRPDVPEAGPAEPFVVRAALRKIAAAQERFEAAHGCYAQTVLPLQRRGLRLDPGVSVQIQMRVDGFCIEAMHSSIVGRVWYLDSREGDVRRAPPIARKRGGIRFLSCPM